jgi:hypothetical protein
LECYSCLEYLQRPQWKDDGVDSSCGRGGGEDLKAAQLSIEGGMRWSSCLDRTFVCLFVLSGNLILSNALH